MNTYIFFLLFLLCSSVLNGCIMDAGDSALRAAHRSRSLFAVEQQHIILPRANHSRSDSQLYFISPLR
uniref:Uncharacterized protein n=1 Tax=Wuchereria bancrofti TaxID=6293 RepID=A0AAF5PX11_WUCBA